MRISVITVCFNSVNYIKSTIESVLIQNHPDVEYIIIDGKSTDGTVELIESYGDRISKWISEPDFGIYDAMNKGISMASGDVVGIVNSDDYFTRVDSLSRIAETLEKYPVESVFADITFVKRDDPSKVVRYFSSESYRPWKMRFGFMPAHPSFFTYKRNFERYGGYNASFEIGADFELILRFLFKHKLSYKYIPIDIMNMRMGGISTQSLTSTLIINKENKRAFKINGFYTNYVFLFSRYFVKVIHYLPAFIKHKKKKNIYLF